MPPVNYQYSSGIIINRCGHAHGLWLDRGELQRIEAFMEGWEARVEEGQARFTSMLEEVRREQVARQKEHEARSGPSSFNMINALLRRIIDLT
jgi:Zn-finger nucleic acid-binding protein